MFAIVIKCYEVCGLLATETFKLLQVLSVYAKLLASVPDKTIYGADLRRANIPS